MTLRGPGKPVQVGPPLDVASVRPVTATLATAADTQAFGARLGALLEPGDLLLLDGPLGAGKTTFAQGVAAGLGVAEPVTSPTFVIARVHRSGRVPFVHADAYRLGSALEVDDLDLDADLETAVTVVEWGADRGEQLSEEHLRVVLDRESAGDGTTRTVSLLGTTRRWAERLEALR